MGVGVAVVGGGIAGVQAALDLADQGIEVHLIEKNPSLGGKMAQLDKTFPTNDCSMCILSPKLVAAARHPNITIYTNSEMRGLAGEAGNFTASIVKKPRYITEEKCTACGLCTEACPVEMNSEFELGLNMRKAAYIPFPQAVPLKFTIHRKGTPPCQASCPAGVHAQGYIALMAQGRFSEALEMHREYNPLPLICGRVCPHPCETVCNRGELDEPVAIAALKRFMADYELEHPGEVEPFPQTSDKKIAIIGSGPAGLTAAYFLTKMGHAVSIFEALPRAGGMMAVGIPDYRLPKDILQAEIDYIKKKGTRIELNTCFGRDFGLEDLKKDGYHAVLLAVGAHASKRMAVPGEELEGVVPGVDFLRALNLGEDITIGTKVAVVGGGDVAVDAVRAARRLGSEAFILYRRTRNEMPAHESEISETEREGIQIHYLTQPVEIIGENGKVEGIECIRMELGEPDESGRRRPVPVKGTEFTIEVDCVMPAIGQSPDVSTIDGMGVQISNTGTIIVDENTQATSVPGVFASGDAVSGPATVVAAVGAGKRAALVMDAFLRGEKPVMEPEPEDVVPFQDLGLEPDIERETRTQPGGLSISEREGNFFEVAGGLTEEEALREASRCLACGGCSGCYRCIEACEPDAIDFNQKEQDIEIKVGAVIAMPGYEHIDPTVRKEYGYGYHDDVITALEFERILSASGPFGGHIRRLSDGSDPRNIAFVQCAGSRDANCGASYCSAVCCMYAIKEAIIAKEHAPGLAIEIFHMDIRAFGKEFDYYYQRARDLGITFTRCRVSDISGEEDGVLGLSLVGEDGEIQTKTFDLVVLSNGIAPVDDARVLAQALGIDLEEHGFCRTGAFNPLETSRPGVYVAGAFSEPKDIPDTVAQASGAGAKASMFAAREEREPGEVADQADMTGDPRIGVLICHCGINIANFVDVEEVARYARTLPNVAHTEDVMYACSQDIQDRIKNLVHEHGLNRLVVASCTPRTHEPLFQGTLESTGLNPYLFEMTNIREHCSWVHMHDKDSATEKAKDLVRMTVAKSNLLTPLARETIDVNPACLVVGGGVSGLTAALDMADNGFEVTMLEREEELGGNLRHVSALISGEGTGQYMHDLVNRVTSHERIKVHSRATLKDIKGYVGNFTAIFEHEGKEKTATSGAVIVATGGRTYEPVEYQCGKERDVITQMELEGLLEKGGFNAGSVVMIQCVGFRDEVHGFCGRVCCSQAVKNALRVKEQNPETDIYILYRDLRTYGFKEDYYAQASGKGVRFIRYDVEDKPVVSAGKNLSVRIRDPVLDEMLIIEPDKIVLSSGMEPFPDNDALAQMLKVPLSRDGFFLEAHMKLRPVDFATDGVFLCGAAHSPKFVDECISQASGAASRAMTILSRKTLRSEGIVSQVDEDLCFGCGICVVNCAYSAVELDEEECKARVISALCKGCGVCGATCPRHAITMNHFTDEQIHAQIHAFDGEVE